MATAKHPDPTSPTPEVEDLGQTVPELEARTTTPWKRAAAESATSAPPAPGPHASAVQASASVELHDKPIRAGVQPLRIGRYILLRAIGEGGMGVVYAAYDEELDRKVAVKLLHPTQQADDQLRSRVLREAQALARVSSPSVVHVYQVGENEGQIFIAMEFVNGTTLSKWQAQPGHGWQDILRMYSAAGQGLFDAHQAGLVHRDFKPDNVFFVERAASASLLPREQRAEVGSRSAVGSYDESMRETKKVLISCSDAIGAGV